MLQGVQPQQRKQRNLTFFQKGWRVFHVSCMLLLELIDGGGGGEQKKLVIIYAIGSFNPLYCD